MKYTFDDLPIGSEVYYTGDCANVDGFAVVTRHRPPDKWHAGSVDVRFDDGREFKGLHLCQFDDSVGRRFMTRAEYQAKRQAKIEAMEQDALAFRARTDAHA